MCYSLLNVAIIFVILISVNNMIIYHAIAVTDRETISIFYVAHCERQQCFHTIMITYHTTIISPAPTKAPHQSEHSCVHKTTRFNLL